MMRVLVTGFTKSFGGIESFVINYIKYITTYNSNIKFDILGYEKHPAYEKDILKYGGKIYSLPSPRHIDSRKKLEQFFKSHASEYNVLWCNKCDLANIDFLKMAKKYGIPKRIIHSHNSANMHQGWRRIVFQLLHEINKRQIQMYATDFWACSDFAAKWFYSAQIISSERYLFIPNAINAAHFAFSNSVRQEYRNKLHLKNEVLVGNVGRFSYQKNHDFLIDIFGAFLKYRPDSKLILIGVGELEEAIKRKVKALNIEKNVLFMGKSSEVAQWMQAMDCFLLPSRFEGLPVVGVEAQAAGLTVFAASDGITKQTKLTEQFHFLSLSMSAQEWAREISKTELTHSNSYNQICEKGFEIESAAKKLYALLIQNAKR